MNAKNRLESGRLKRIINLIHNRNTDPKLKGFRTEKEIVQAYIENYPDDPSLTQGKLSKIIKGTVEKQNGVYAVLDDMAKYRILENALKKANAHTYEVKEFAIECERSVMDLFITLEKHYLGQIFDVRFDKRKLYFKALYKTSHLVETTENGEIEPDYHYLVEILTSIEYKLNNAREVND